MLALNEKENINEKLLEYLIGFITENKKEKIINVSQYRTEYLTVALEDIKETKDASAVIRSCEVFGINSISIINNNTKYKINHDVAMGSYKWVNINQFREEKTNNTKVCLDFLKAKGFRIVATTPKRDVKSIYDLSLDQKTAFFFGSEENGLSQEVFDNADEMVTIPMYGETESFNLSVSAAIIIHTMISRLRESNIEWKLSPKELTELRINWIRKIIKRVPEYEKRFFEQYF